MRRLIASLSVLVALCAVAAIGVSSGGMFGNWTTTRAAPNQSVAAATIGLSLTTTMGTTIDNVVPGDTATRYIQVTNATGGLTWSKLALRMRANSVTNDAGNPGGAATTTQWAASANVVVRVAQCTAGWNYNSGNPACTTWSGWSTVTVGDGASWGSFVDYTSSLPAAGAVVGFKVEWAIQSGAVTNLQGSTVTYNTELVATQRAGAVQ